MATYEHHKPCDLPNPESTHSFWHTEPSPLLKGHRTTRKLPSKTDVVIVGSGITGASIAHHLLNTGESNGDVSVVMLEAREACWGATGRNGGHCQPLIFEHPDDPSIGRFELNNYISVASLAETRFPCEFVRQPSVRGIYGKGKLAEAEAALAKIRAVAPEMASMVRIITSREELAHYRLPTATGALHTARAARLWPYKFVSGVLEHLLTGKDLAGSFNLQTLTPVNKIQREKDGRWTVKTDRGQIDAGAVFLATNGYTSHLLPGFVDLIVPCRGQMSALKPTPSVAGEHRLKTSMGFEGQGVDDYLIQRPSESGEQLMFGGGRQVAPSLGISDDSTIDKDVAKYLRRSLPERFQLTDAKDSELDATHEWSGIMGFSRDGLPWVGPIPGQEELYVSAGYTGHGMPNAWLCGKALSCMYFFKGNQHEAIDFAQASTGLPAAYLVTMERVKRALEVEALEKQETLQKQIDELMNDLHT